LDFVVYEMVGKPPVDLTGNVFPRKIVLCRLDSNQLDCVYTKAYHAELAICQSIVYEILYRTVFHLHTELEESVQIIREQNKNKNRNGVFPIVDAESSPDSSHSGEDSFSKHEKFAGRRVSPPVPYRIAKALDPVIYRNTELDIWEEEKREAIHRERYKSVTFSAGDKCQVLSTQGPLYHGHIQQIGPEATDPAIVFIEELGEKQEVSRDRLRPAKASGRSEWFLKQLRRKRLQEMTVTQDRMPPMMPQSLPPPPIQVVPTSPLPQEVNSSIIFPKWQILSSSPGPIQATKPESLGSYPPGPPPEMSLIPVSQVQVPRIWVPYMDSIALSNVDVNILPSQDSMGQDLPINDMNTLRFFFNVGVAHYGLISQQALANRAASQGNIQPIIYCQAKPPMALPQIGNCTFSLHSPPPASNSDDESSNMSNDSGCDADETTASHKKSVGASEANSPVREGENSPVGEATDSSTAQVENPSCETESRCSDMSLTDTSDGAITIENQEQGGAKQYKPRRKYYMYGNLKLIKPIKDVPKRFMDLLTSMNAEKSRVEGEPIIMAAPAQYKSDRTTNCQFNPNAPSFVPGSHGDRAPVNGNHINIPLSSSSSNVYYPSQLISLPNSNVSYHSSSVISTHPHFQRNPLHTGFPPPLPPMNNPPSSSFVTVNSMPH
ncbi:uncharacterized protein LOC134255310, partial [Saccostrea cucullata]|uniref:uncharacterized protein LOC134255310 n=1 Tax=Saccostrea cuccullata TaxID=36930 RepID=UPI002ED68D18